MSSRFDMQAELVRLKADYASAADDDTFKHFYCPILLKDEATELCAGHIVNASIPNSCRTCVVQRKDVDGFYGSLVESGYTTALKAKGRSVDDMLEDPQFRRQVPWSVSVNGSKIEHYEVRGRASSAHPLVHIQDRQGDFLTIALKVSPDELPKSAKLQITFERSYVSEAVATLLKAAHLTMFSVFGYNYVFSAAGLELARILREFYLANVNEPREKKVLAMNEYFHRYAGMIIPLAGYATDIARGSIEDKRFMVCVGSSGQFFACGVLVRANDHMSVVLLPPDKAEPMDTYFSFTRDFWKGPFHYHLADFVGATQAEEAHWKGYRNRFEFDPGPKPSDEEIASFVGI